MRHFSGEFEGVRLLMLDELDAIAGGDGEDTDDGSGPPPDPNTGPDIVVTARSGGGGYDQATWNYYCTYFNDIDYNFPAAGNGGGTPGGTEAGIDHKACEAAELIKNSPNSSHTEYGYFIISDENGDRLSPVFTSNSSEEIVFGAGNHLSLASIGAASWSQVKGFVHNHPSEIDDPLIPGDINIQNRMPSPADWDIADSISAAAGAAGSDFRNYIIGPDGVSRQYDVGDSRTKVSSDTSGGNCH